MDVTTHLGPPATLDSRSAQAYHKKTAVSSAVPGHLWCGPPYGNLNRVRTPMLPSIVWFDRIMRNNCSTSLRYRRCDRISYWRWNETPPEAWFCTSMKSQQSQPTFAGKKGSGLLASAMAVLRTIVPHANWVTSRGGINDRLTTQRVTVAPFRWIGSSSVTTVENPGTVRKLTFVVTHSIARAGALNRVTTVSPLALPPRVSALPPSPWNTTTDALGGWTCGFPG